ncbi:MAG: hypothetical protein QMC90_03405 [Dehalococcoidales bacterium]|nr:hypothetical protein [Dehalococcoidales bacterium]
MKMEKDKKEKKPASTLEQEARKLRRRKERLDREIKIPAQALPPPKSAEELFEEMKQRREEPEFAAISWKQYAPFKPEKPKQRRFLNAASIWVFARKMIAQEWKRARGIPSRDDPVKLARERLESFAADYKRRKEEERIRQQKAEEEKRRRQQKEAMLEAMIGESLEAFAMANQSLKAEREEHKALTGLFRQALDTVGQVFELSRSDGGWNVHLEPWEERKSRRLRGEGDGSPVIYEMKIDKDFTITSCRGGSDSITAKRVLDQLNHELDKKVRKPLEQVAEAKPRPMVDIGRESFQAEREKEREVARVCDQALEDFGRVMKVSKAEDGWKVRIEVWDEMGVRGRKPTLFELKVDEDLKIVSYEAV